MAGQQWQEFQRSQWHVPGCHDHSSHKHDCSHVGEKAYPELPRYTSKHVSNTVCIILMRRSYVFKTREEVHSHLVFFTHHLGLNTWLEQRVAVSLAVIKTMLETNDVLKCLMEKNYSSKCIWLACKICSLGVFGGHIYFMFMPRFFEWRNSRCS